MDKLRAPHTSRLYFKGLLKTKGIEAGKEVGVKRNGRRRRGNREQKEKERRHDSFLTWTDALDRVLCFVLLCVYHLFSLHG